MDLEQPCKTVGNSIYQAGFEGFLPSMTTCGLTGGRLKKQAGKERHKSSISPFPQTLTAGERQGLPGNWDVLEAAGHHPCARSASREGMGAQEGSPWDEPGKGHTAKAHLGMATRAKAAASALH